MQPDPNDKNKILIASSDILQQFYSSTSSASILSYNILDVLENACATIEYKDEETFKARAWQFYSRNKVELEEEGYDAETADSSAKILSKGFAELCISLIAIYNQLGLYGSDNHANWHFYGVIGDDIILACYD